MYGFKTKILTALFAIFLIIGCGGGSNSSDLNKRPSLNESNVINTATEEVVLNESQFSDGVVTEDVAISAEAEDGTKATEIIISEGTEFVDDKGEPVISLPTVSIVQQESVEEVVKNGKITTKNVVKTELELVDEKGNKIIPSKPMDITMKAPVGTKPGDEVRVDMPDGATASKSMIQKKLIVVVVGTDGNIHVRIFPEIFKRLTVIIILVERMTSTPITGGTGGN